MNGGHLVRIVGAGFELVRSWAEAGVPLTIVFRGIEVKAERHRLGRARRPLRIEFCESDVREIYESWRRAVGVPRTGPADEPPDEPAASRRAPSPVKRIDRAIDRLGRVAGRLDLPEPFLRTIDGVLEELAALREVAAKARGPARGEVTAQLQALDGRLLLAARAATDAPAMDTLSKAASTDLAAFRDRLDEDAWRRAIDVTLDRFVRDLYGLPTLDVG